MKRLALADSAQGRDNNFLLIRMVLATMVVFTHSYTFTDGDEHLEPLFRLTSVPMGYVAVDMFFIMSGFLIAQSWIRRSDLASFMMSRVTRIYPALWVNVAFVLIVSTMITSIPLREFLAHTETWKWTAKNLLMVFGSGGDLPGDFVNNPHPTWTNVSLWTLSWELYCYFAIAIIGLVGAFRHRLALLGFSAIICGVHLYSSYVDLENWTSDFRFPAMFAAGMCFFLFRDKIRLHWGAFALSSLGLLLSMVFAPAAFEWIYPILLPYFTICLVFLPGGWIRNYNQCGDYSYGMYIYGGFIGQVVAMIPAIGLLPHLGLTFGITLGLAALSWHLVEKRILESPWKQPTTDWIRQRIARVRSQTV